jgi:hypothetical protein
LTADRITRQDGAREASARPWSLGRGACRRRVTHRTRPRTLGALRDARIPLETRRNYETRVPNLNSYGGDFDEYGNDSDRDTDSDGDKIRDRNASEDADGNGVPDYLEASGDTSGSPCSPAPGLGSA